MLEQLTEMDEDDAGTCAAIQVVYCGEGFGHLNIGYEPEDDSPPIIETNMIEDGSDDNDGNFDLEIKDDALRQPYVVAVMKHKGGKRF